MLKRKRITIPNAMKAIQIYDAIPIQFVDIALEDALLIVDKLQIYAYDAYIISCAIKYHCELISLDNGLITAAKNLGVKTREIQP